MNENMKHERRQLKNANIYTRTTTVHHTNTHTQDIKRACRCDVTAASHTQWWIPGMGLWGPRGGATVGGHSRWWIPCNGLCGSSPGAPTSGWGRGALEKKCAKRLVSHLRWLGPHWDLSPWAYNVVIRPYPCIWCVNVFLTLSERPQRLHQGITHTKRNTLRHFLRDIFLYFLPEVPKNHISSVNLCNILDTVLLFDVLFDICYLTYNYG